MKPGLSLMFNQGRQLTRCCELSGFALVVDAKDETAARFQEHLEFMRLPGDSLRLIRIL